MPADQPPSSATGVAWDLGDLYHAVDDPRLEADLQAALGRAQAFEKDYRGRIAALQPDQADTLARAVRELEALYEVMDKPAVYASLLHAGKTDEPRHGALLARTQEQRTEVNKHLIFFDLEWVQVPDAIAQGLAGRPELARYRHWLEQKRIWKPHYLSEPEEKILDRKIMTGRSAFARLFEETTATIRFPFTHGGETRQLSLQEILARLYDPD